MWAVPEASVAYCMLAAAKLISVTFPKILIELLSKVFKPDILSQQLYSM